MGKPINKNKLSGLHVEVVHVAAPDAPERIRKAVDILLAVADGGKKCNTDIQARASSHAPCSQSSSSKAKEAEP